MAILNHVGIAVGNPAPLRRLFELLGLAVNHSESVPEQGVVAHFIPLPVEPGNLELLEVTDPNGAVSKFLNKRGPGVHHLSFLFARGELDPICVKLKAGGFQLVYDKPKAGAHAMRINFVHPASAGGILIELMEPA
jgi:methylmalonyl-CoA/ethylmalonyl-CoA epimerase